MLGATSGASVDVASSPGTGDARAGRDRACYVAGVRRLVLLWLVVGCSSTEPAGALSGDAGTGGARDATSGEETSVADAAEAAPEAGGDASSGPTKLRVMAANLTSGSNQSYDSGEGLRIMQGLKPDVVLIQEFNYGTNTDAYARTMVDKTFGASFSFYREPLVQIPNGIISRFPIDKSGSWTDPDVANRGFAWAKLVVPGSRGLWAVSLHLLTTSATNRDSEAKALVAQVKTAIPDADYLVVGGDLNTDVRTEPCMATLGEIAGTVAPFPDDGHMNGNTNLPRTKPHDWVLADVDLAPLQIATVYGSNSFDSGLVFDSRVYTPLADVPPILATDSAATNMQHMAVVKDFALP